MNYPKLAGMRPWCVLLVALAFASACSGDDSGNTDGDPSGFGPGDDGDSGDGDGDGDGDSEDATGSDSDDASDPGDSDGSDSDDASSDDSAGGPSSSGFVPQFPGAGTAADTAPLKGGMLCDAVEGEPLPIPPTVTRCFFGPDDKKNPAATIEQALECAEETNTIHLRLTFDPNFNDNTYGEGSIGWPEKRGHRFRDLTGSDHAELVLIDGDGEVAMQFKIDYLSEDSDAPSGYASLGVSGGDGSVSIGDETSVVAHSTSLDKNLNERGYGDYIESSPLTDESYTPNDDTPEWDYRVVFEVWIDLETFGDAGFGGAFIDYVHASPAKKSTDTIEVMPEECPPDGQCDDPDNCEDDPCYDGDPDTVCDQDDPPGDDGDDPCWDGDPDTFCAGGGPDGMGEPAFCDRYPTDPSCRVD